MARSVNVSTEATGSMRTVISFGSEEFIDLLYSTAVGAVDGPDVVCWLPKKTNSTYGYGVKKAVVLKIIMPVAMWIATSCVTLITWYAYHLVMDGTVTFGE